MKSILSVAMIAGCISSAVGCSYAARSPENYRDDTQAALASKNDVIRACYDGVLKSAPGAQGAVTVNFEVETEHGTIGKVEVDKAATTAPEAVAECVTKNIAGLAIAPPDARTGQGTFSWNFAAPKAPSKS